MYGLAVEIAGASVGSAVAVSIALGRSGSALPLDEVTLWLPAFVHRWLARCCYIIISIVVGRLRVLRRLGLPELVDARDPQSTIAVW